MMVVPTFDLGSVQLPDRHPRASDGTRVQCTVTGHPDGAIVATPGHTPGDRSVVVEDGEHVTVLGGPCSSDGAEFTENRPAATDLHDETCLPAARRSIERLRSIDPDTLHQANGRMIRTRRS